MMGWIGWMGWMDGRGEKFFRPYCSSSTLVSGIVYPEIAPAPPSSGSQRHMVCVIPIGFHIRGLCLGVTIYGMTLQRISL